MFGGLIGRAFFLFLLPHSPLATRLSPLTHRLPLGHWCKTNCERITFLPALTAFCLSFPSPVSLLFSLYLGNDDQCLATPVRHQYTLNTVFSSFSSFLLTFS